MTALPLLGRLATFRHGVHPDERKDATEGLAIERIPFVDEYVLPLSQHLGGPSKAIVEVGQRVERGQMIAEASGYVSVALHAPVTGTVRAIEMRPHPTGKRMPAIVIATDPFSAQRLTGVEPPPVKPPEGGEFTRRVQEAGMVGLGGAAFPSHVKLSVPEGKSARFVILNGCECEPYLTCDHRVMLERAETVVRGLRLIMAQVGAERGYIGVESNKADAVEVLRVTVAGDDAIETVALQVKYPQGAEKMLIDAVLHREVPPGKFPIDIEIIVHNVGTAAAIVDLFDLGQPLIERVVTVTGPGVRRPANLLVPLGTPLRAVLDHCDGLRPETRQVILGGPMMGFAQKDLAAPITKGVSGILATLVPAARVEEEPCIRCGRCVEGCPMFLNPCRLAQLAQAAQNPDSSAARDPVLDLKAYHVLDCFEC
ncbi:MAG: electron transport complex subunit RsxC, partial [bacterium]|nr:electron transport complex subunit RsxC [bacterium]